MLRSEFLDDYKNNCFNRTKLNKNIRELLDFLNMRKIITGVVTNKHSRYVNPIVEGLGIVSELD